MPHTKRAVATPYARGFRAGRAAFTLIELLVVIAIIAILASMLMPALNGAKEKGRQAVCLGNIRSTGMACLTYALDWDNSVEYPGGTQTLTFTNKSGGTVSLTKTWSPSFSWLGYGLVYRMRDYGVGRGSHRCPSDPSAYGGNWDKQSYAGLWSAGDKATIETDKDFYSSYMPWTPVFIWADGSNAPKKLDAHTHPEREFLLLETTISSAEQSTVSGACYYYASVHGKGRNTLPAGGSASRGMSSFLDGHAEIWDWSRCSGYEGSDRAPYDTSSGNWTTNPNLK